MTLQELIDEMGYHTRSYSGRGMMGKECLGVSVYDDFEFGIELGTAITASDSLYLIATIQEYKKDNMGRDTIIYWPNIPYKEDK